MAWIERRANGLVVRWRAGSWGPGGSRKFKFGQEEEAQACKREHEASPVDKLEAEAKRRGEYVDFTGKLDRWGNPKGIPGGADERYQFERYARETVEAHKDLARTTRALYLRTIRSHIADTELAGADVRGVTHEELDRWWSGLKVGNGALRNIHEVLSKTVKRALRQGLRADNPLDRADLKKPRKPVRQGVRPLTTAEVERLANSASSPRDRLEVLVMACGGLRAGEVGGLRVEDIDWQKGRLDIRQQVRRISGDGLEVAELKTKAAKRPVTLPRWVADELREFVGTNPPADDGRVFHGLEGGMRDSVRINRSVQRSAKRAGIETHAHALRHTAVSMWIADGANPVEVQHMVGHEDVETTLSQYAHLFSFGGEDLARRMEKRWEEHRNGNGK